jgi:hypothetical protein
VNSGGKEGDITSAVMPKQATGGTTDMKKVTVCVQLVIARAGGLPVERFANCYGHTIDRESAITVCDDNGAVVSYASGEWVRVWHEDEPQQEGEHT